MYTDTVEKCVLVFVWMCDTEVIEQLSSVYFTSSGNKNQK